MADAGTGVFPIGDGYSLDLGNAIDAHPFAHAVVRDPAAVAAVKRTAVRTAILLVRPQKR
ncbi:hypothetical protein [Methylobacterium oxalidis]|uniref:hypothetical protein n=1 Tax=Methylobacterium oxalidis TaxID=944322 RepID=UPI003315DEEE